MQRYQFKEKIIKQPNYYQNKYYIIKLCTKNSYNIKICDIFHQIHGFPILNMLICQLNNGKNH